MATLFTVAPSNRSNTKLQNKKREFPIPSKQEHFASTDFHHTGNTANRVEVKKKTRVFTRTDTDERPTAEIPKP